MVGVKDYKISYSGSRTYEYTLADISDFHAGNEGLDKSLLKRTVKWCEQHADGVILGGDYADAIDHKDKRFEWTSLDRTLATPDEQYDYVKATLKPLRGKVLGVIEGNHDYKIKADRGHDYVKELAEYLDVDPKATGSSVFLRLKFNTGGRWTKFDVFAHHGATNSRSKGGKINKLEEMDRVFEADLYFMSHVHDFAPSMSPVMTVDNHMNVVERRRYYALTGGFLKGYEKGVSNYVERGLFKPTILGGVYANLHASKTLRSNIRIWEIPVEGKVYKEEAK